MADPSLLRFPIPSPPIPNLRRAAGQAAEAGISGTIVGQRGGLSGAVAGGSVGDAARERRSRVGEFTVGEYGVMAMPGAEESRVVRDAVEQRRTVGGRAVSTPYADGEAEVPGAVAVGVGMLTPSLSFQSPDGAVLQTRIAERSCRRVAGTLPGIGWSVAVGGEKAGGAAR